MLKNRKQHKSISDEHELSINNFFFFFRSSFDVFVVAHSKYCSAARIHVFGVRSMRSAFGVSDTMTVVKLEEQICIYRDGRHSTNVTSVYSACTYGTWSKHSMSVCLSSVIVPAPTARPAAPARHLKWVHARVEWNETNVCCRSYLSHCCFSCTMND